MRVTCLVVTLFLITVFLQTVYAGGCELLLRDGVRDHWVSHLKESRRTTFDQTICSEKGFDSNAELGFAMDGVPMNAKGTGNYREEMCDIKSTTDWSNRIESAAFSFVSRDLVDGYNKCKEIEKRGVVYEGNYLPDAQEFIINIRYAGPFPSLPNISGISSSAFTCSAGTTVIGANTPLKIPREFLKIICKRKPDSPGGKTFKETQIEVDFAQFEPILFPFAKTPPKLPQCPVMVEAHAWEPRITKRILMGPNETQTFLDNTFGNVARCSTDSSCQIKAYRSYTGVPGSDGPWKAVRSSIQIKPPGGLAYARCTVERRPSNKNFAGLNLIPSNLDYTASIFNSSNFFD